MLSAIALRDYAILCIGLSMGFRASDIVELRFKDIDWKNNSISIVQKKTGKLLTMPMPIKTGNIIYSYLRNCRPKSKSPYIFIRHKAPYEKIKSGVCTNALKRFINAPDNSNYGFHIVRKTFATQLLESNVNVELISDSLGHSTDSTVSKYLSLNEKRMHMCALSLLEANIPYKGGGFDA